MKKLLVFCFVLLVNPAWSQESSTETRWYVLLSDQHFQCAGFLSASSDVLQRRFPELSEMTQEAARDATARGIIYFKREFPKASNIDFLTLHLELYLNKYKEIWERELGRKDEQEIQDQLMACQELLPSFKATVEPDDFIPSLGI